MSPQGLAVRLALLAGCALFATPALATPPPPAAQQSGKRLPAPFWALTKDAPRYAIAGGLGKATIVLEGQAYMGLLEGKPGLVVPPHSHPKSIEMLYVLEGGGWMTIARQRTRVIPGMVIQVPAGVQHSFEIPKDAKQDFKAVQVYTPSGPQTRFKQGTRIDVPKGR